MTKRIAIVAYACAPLSGSEPGMAWNIIKRLRNDICYDVYVEQEKFQDVILQSQFYKEAQHSSWYFIKKRRRRLLRKIFPPSYYWYYKEWHQNVFDLIQSKFQSYDAVHNLNMVGYREMGMNWKLDLPWIWGPVGGTVNTSWQLLLSTDIQTFFYYGMRNIVNSIDLNFNRRITQISKRNLTTVVSASRGDQLNLKSVYGLKSKVMREVGIDKFLKKVTEDIRYDVVWVGSLNNGKNLKLLLKALANIPVKLRVVIIGGGPKKAKLIARSKNKQLRHHEITFTGRISLASTNSIIARSKIGVITSLKDLTSTVLMEYLSYYKPVVALGHMGFGEIMEELKLPVVSISYKGRKMAHDLANEISRYIFDEQYYRDSSNKIAAKIQSYSWENIAEFFNNEYSKISK